MHDDISQQYLCLKKSAHWILINFYDTNIWYWVHIGDCPKYALRIKFNLNSLVAHRRRQRRDRLCERAEESQAGAAAQGQRRQGQLFNWIQMSLLSSYDLIRLFIWA